MEVAASSGWKSGLATGEAPLLEHGMVGQAWTCSRCVKREDLTKIVSLSNLVLGHPKKV